MTDSVSVQNGVAQALDVSLATVKQHGVSFQRIDPIAFSGRGPEAATRMFKDILGFELKHRLHIKNEKTGMISPEIESNRTRFTLCQGTEDESQMFQPLRRYGLDVAKATQEVKGVDNAADVLPGSILQFDTVLVGNAGLTQVCSTRCLKAGPEFEIIHRNGENGFL
jgi:hypothetical protein